MVGSKEGNQHVWQIDRAYSPYVRDSRPAVDQDMVVGLQPLIPRSLEVPTEVLCREKRLPVQLVQSLSIVCTPSTRRNQTQWKICVRDRDINYALSPVQLAAVTHGGRKVHNPVLETNLLAYARTDRLKVSLQPRSL